MGGMTGSEAPERAMADDVVLARAYLSRVCEAGCVPLWGFVERVGPVEAARAVQHGSGPWIGDVGCGRPPGRHRSAR